MRVVCNNVEEFLECIAQEPVLFQDTIRVSVFRRTEGEGDIKKEVGIQVSAVVIDGESQYLLEAGENCGKDYYDDPPETEGSDRAKKLKEEVKQFASRNNLKVMPGIIHE